MERAHTEIWATPLLAGFSGEVGARLTSEPRQLQLEAGEWLFREGDRADSAYLVRTGRLEVVVEHPAEVVVRQVKRGALVGELALLTRGFRTASARASRDTELTELSRAQFEELVLGSPIFALGLLQSMANQLAAIRAPADPPAPPGTIALVGLDAGAPALAVGAELAAQLSAYGRVAELGPDTDRLESEFRNALKRAEAGHGRVVMTTGATTAADPWTRFCLKEADVVIAVTTGSPTHEWLDRPLPLHDCELIVVDAQLSSEVHAKLMPREAHVVRGTAGLTACIESTARRLAGRSLGLVLSGGGARALAHVGVLEELEASGLRIDRLAGASMGAIVSGLAARGASSAEIMEMCRRLMLESNPSNDYTFPAFSIVRGVKARRALAEVFAGQRIEELPRRWFCVASDLVARELIIHKTGPMADAVYSSMALPGIYPPIPTGGGRLLVDGGVMDNLPVETMASRAEGPIIAVDVSQRLGIPRPATRPGLERLARRARHLLTGHERPVPRLRETIHWTIALGSRDTVSAGMRHADLVIAPHVEGIGILDWKELPRTLEMGRRAAREALEAARDQIDVWRSTC